MEFLTSLVSAQTYYLRACLRMIVKLFLPGNNETKCCIFPSNLDCLIFFYFINGFKSIELNILLGVSSVTILRKVFFLSIRCAPPPTPCLYNSKRYLWNQWNLEEIQHFQEGLLWGLYEELTMSHNTGIMWWSLNHSHLGCLNFCKSQSTLPRFTSNHLIWYNCIKITLLCI